MAVHDLDPPARGPGAGAVRRTLPSLLLAPGRVAVAIAVAATFVVGVCAVNAIARIGKPFPGFFVWENLFVPAVGETSWTGVRSGLQYQSWLIEVNGERVVGAGELEAALQDREAGAVVTYGLEKNGAAYAIHAPVMTLTPRAWASVLGLYILDAIVLLAAGLVVLYLKPADAAARALFYFSTNLALYLATSADLFGPYRFRIPYFLFVNLVPFTVCRLLSHFPVGRERSSIESRGLAALAVVAVTLAVASNLAFYRDHELLVLLDRATHVLLAAAGLGAIVFFGFHFAHAKTALVRARTLVVLLGTLGAFAPPVIVLSLMYGLGVPFPLNVVTLTFLLFPLSIAYAIARHDLFDIDRIIRRTLTYAVLSALVFAAYSLGIGVVDYFFENLTALGSRIAEGLLILTLILFTSPSRDRIQDFVDRVYDRHRYSYRDVVRSASREFATLLDFEKLVSAALALIDGTVQPVRAAVFTVDAGGKARPRGRLQHEPGEEPRVTIELDARSVIDVAKLADSMRRVSIVSADDPSAASAYPGLLALPASLDAALVAPMTLEGRLVGLLAAGPKRSGRPYTKDDHELVRTICDQLSVALENAQAYRTIDLLNEDLADKNVALEHSNLELRQAQSELVRQERLAAVGELAGAVAHAIRNPLAGIKAAAQLASLDLDGHEAAESLRDVISETDRLDQRIGALLQFSRPFEPELRPASAAGIVTNAVCDTAARAAARRIVVRTTIDPNLPEIFADPVLLEQAVLELISNAIDASPDADAIDVSVTTVLDENERLVRIEVVDSGPGIDERAVGRIFDLFYTTKARGTGFGLATVKKIVERHGGRIEASNRDGRGASFRISLLAR